MQSFDSDRTGLMANESANPENAQKDLRQRIRQTVNGLSSGQRAEFKNVIMEAQGWTSGVTLLEFVLFLAALAWTAAFIAFVSLNHYNTRWDYNTDFLGTDSCGIVDDDDHDVCQEVDLRRVHGVDIHWHYLAMFITLSATYVWSLIFVTFLKRSSQIVDDDAIAAEQMGDKDVNGWWRILDPRGIIGRITWPARYLAMQYTNSLPLMYYMRHIVFDSIIVSIGFAMLGVRDLWKTGFIFALVIMWNVFSLFAQVDNRASWIISKLELISGRKIQRSIPVWFMPLCQTIFGATIWSVLLVYYVKFPHKSRNWYLHMYMLTVLINIGLRTLFNAVRWACNDMRIMAKMNPRAGWIMYFFQSIAYLAYWITRPLCMYPFAVQIVLSLYDIWYYFVPWLMLVGLDGHSNIAQMRFPSAVIFAF